MPSLGTLSSPSFEPSSIVTYLNNHRREPLTIGPQRIPGATLLAATETVLALVAVAIVLIVTNLAAMPDGVDSFLSIQITLRNVLLLSVLATAWPLILHSRGLYNSARIRSAADERMRVIGACTLGSAAAVIIASIGAAGEFAIRDLVYFWLLTSSGTLALREVHRRLIRRPYHRRVLLVGSGLRALQMWQSLSADVGASCELVGVVECPDCMPAKPAVDTPYLGPLDQLEGLLMRHAIDEVCVALPVKSHYREIQMAIRTCERVGVRTKYQADLFDREVAWPRFDEPGTPTVTLHMVADDYRLTVKRCLDVIGAVVALIVLSPVMLAAAVAIKATSAGPVIFAQERYGLNRRRFRMFKFRTMFPDAEQLQPALELCNEADGPVFKISNDPRVTPVGRFLRRMSIDELPQLINVLRGEMSLVGPRPLPPRDVTRFTRASDMRRFSVRPGLTCLWQISGRSTLSFSDWIRLDLKYIDGWSLALDLLILLQTVPAVLWGRGAR
jgi:exopolysaccharide biosynthesis polyprenyl glycosylphosphotransferase